MSLYETVATDVKFTGHFGRLRVDQVRFPDGVASREVVEHLPAVAVVALDDADRIVFVRQYRHPLQAVTTEIPAGLRDVEGEDPAATAHRELAEEVGLAAAAMEPLGSFENSAGWTDERTAMYLATGLTEVSAPDGFVLEAEEAQMTIERRPFDVAYQQVLTGEITDSKTVIGILLAAAKR